jgi:hypothetical protein
LCLTKRIFYKKIKKNILLYSYLHLLTFLQTHFHSHLYLHSPKQPKLPYIKALKLHPNRHSPGHLNHLRLATAPKRAHLAPTDSFNELRLACAKLARKQANTSLALRLAAEQLQALYAKFLPDTRPASADALFGNLKRLARSLPASLSLREQVVWLETEREAAKLLYQLSPSKLDSVEILTCSIAHCAQKYLLLSSQQQQQQSVIASSFFLINYLIHNQRFQLCAIT